MLPLVTIVIPFYNCPYVQLAIESALAQTYPHVEIIVVDDGSWKYRHLLLPYSDRVRIIRKGNGGTASALNAGIRRANGEYIAWLSSDDRFYADKLARQMGFMLTHGANVSFTDYDLVDGHNRITRISASPKFGTVTAFYRYLLSGCPINGCTVILSKRLLGQAGLFNERLPFTHDYDLWLRIILQREDFYFLNHRTVQYRKHGGAGSVKHQFRIQKEARLTQRRYASRLEALIASLEKEGIR
ncbi:glycosyltransferase [Paenibacillus sp. IB182496]|uniref:Glycosyltransferase n=1 Tax=Paenibacillus sabuli TaxID=2772509 RepID=A0A927BV21_9BACL|nr:glycosyltransferase [Paenibacillus sabuli]MBD2846426.1 glycosyltransferase [Paenibacillus sabuli]